MTTLQKIVSAAKKLKKQHPNKYSKWTDYIKAAAKTVKPAAKKAVKKVGAVKAKKKAAPAKRKAPAVKHTDKGSHNVKIRVVSGTGTIYSVRDKLEKSVELDLEMLARYQLKLKKVGGKGLVATQIRKSISNIKKMLAHDKKQLKEQNKLITQLLK
jgi:hypothetical protein